MFKVDNKDNNNANKIIRSLLSTFNIVHTFF